MCLGKSVKPWRPAPCHHGMWLTGRSCEGEEGKERKVGKQILRKSKINKKIRVALIGHAPPRPLTYYSQLSTNNWLSTLNPKLCSEIASSLSCWGFSSISLGSSAWGNGDWKETGGKCHYGQRLYRCLTASRNASGSQGGPNSWDVSQFALIALWSLLKSQLPLCPCQSDSLGDARDLLR